MINPRHPLFTRSQRNRDAMDVVMQAGPRANGCMVLGSGLWGRGFRVEDSGAEGTGVRVADVVVQGKGVGWRILSYSINAGCPCPSRLWKM